MTKAEVLQLKMTATRVRMGVIEATHSAKSGHPGGSLSAADVLTYLYFKVLNVDTENPQDPTRDRFVLSKGHAAPALYSVLAERGFFPVQDLTTLRHDGSYLEGHPNMNTVPGVDMSTGLDDSISRPAVRTVDKGITISAIRWGVELSFALGTYGDVRRNESRSGFYAAVTYCKAVESSGRLCQIRRSICTFCPDRFDLCHGRRGRFQFLDEMFQLFRLSLQDSFQSCGGVADPAADMVL